MTTDREDSTDDKIMAFLGSLPPDMPGDHLAGVLGAIILAYSPTGREARDVMALTANMIQQYFNERGEHCTCPECTIHRLRTLN